jgi:hypothetical protein
MFKKPGGRSGTKWKKNKTWCFDACFAVEKRLPIVAFGTALL